MQTVESQPTTNVYIECGIGQDRRTKHTTSALLLFGEARAFVFAMMSVTDSHREGHRSRATSIMWTWPKNARCKEMWNKQASLANSQ